MFRAIILHTFGVQVALRHGKDVGPQVLVGGVFDKCLKPCILASLLVCRGSGPKGDLMFQGIGHESTSHLSGNLLGVLNLKFSRLRVPSRKTKALRTVLRFVGEGPRVFG